jgi:NAD(P)-dependent dehydrogenase (short-subunit alcohol dehydrogenase family)
VESGVIAIVVKHTGYPEDFLELDQDLEGELGIDTVKQAEIMADCRETFGLPVDESFQLRDHPTLSHMIAYVHSMGDTSNDDPSNGTPSDNSNSLPSGGSEPSPVSKPAPQTPSTEPENSTVRRWQVEVEEAERGPREPLELAGSHVIVTDDSWGVAKAICSRLEEAGIDAVRLMLDPSVVTKVKVENKGGVDIIRMDPGNEDHLSQLRERLAEFDISGIIHVAPCTLAGMAWAEVTSQQQTQMVCHGLFGVLRAVDSKLAARDGGIVCSVSALDGRHGAGGHRFNPLGAGAHGIVKSYGREHPHLRCRALDVAPELLAEPEQLADAILAEIEQPGPKEVGLDSDGRRWTLCIYDESLEGERTPLASDDVYLVSGGGSGVTASCIVGLAIANRDVGAHFALLGRTKLEDSLVKLAGASEAELEERKMELRVQMQKDSDSGKVTIVEWEDAWARMRRSIDIHQTVAIINSTGNTASYHQCDVTRGKQIRKVLKKLKKKRGPITGIVHGAGIEDSKLVADKEWSTFQRVLSVKVDGWQAMVNAANDHGSDLRFCCAFTSIAGRFGNAGQVDYAAANSILDAEMSRIAHTPGRQRGVALAWTGWRDVGMATRGSIETVFEQAGIETVPVDLGVEIFVDEVMRGGKRRVVVAGELGVLDEEVSVRDPPQRVPADVALLIEEANRFPFVERITSHEPYEELSYECTLDVERFPFLEDHAIDEVPYHPGVMAMEMFAEAAQLLWPPCTVIGFEQVEFGLPVKLMREQQKVRVRAQFERQDDASIWVRCSLESDLVNKEGVVFGEPRLHHQGTVRLLKQGADRGLRRLPSIGAPSSTGISFQPSFIYKRFFHGPRFQAHGGISRGCRMDDCLGADGIALMRHQLPNPQQFDGEPVELEAMPMLIEACFQNAGMVAMEVDRLQSLPVGVEQVELIRHPGGDERLRMRAVRRGSEEDGITVHDCVVIDGSGRPVLALNGLRLKGMAPIDESNWFVLNRN